MFDPIDFDPALLAEWPLGDGGVLRAPVPESATRALEIKQAADALLLETKAVEASAEPLHALLGEMTTEMRHQFEVFKRIRVEAEAKLGSIDEADVKLAKADIKASNDALSLVVRTIEKLDSLQRSLAHDRELAAEQEFDQAAYDAMLVDIDRKIDARAEERMQAWLAERGLDGRAGTGPPADEGRVCG